jgi:peroxiredoxin
MAVTVALRAFFLIDRQGIVRGQWRGTPEDVLPSEPILEVVRAISAKP